MPKIEKIFLTTSVFVDNCSTESQLPYNLQLASYNRGPVKKTPKKEEFRFIAEASFDLMYGIEKPAMVLFCGWCIEYSAPDKKDFEVLQDPVILAHIVSYLREHISNLTIKSRLPALYLDTINTFKLWERYQESQNSQKEPKKKPPRRIAQGGGSKD